MECATLFTVGFSVFVPIGALMLISDMPLLQTGIKTKTAAKNIFANYAKKHVEMGISVLQHMQKRERQGFGYQF